MYSVHDIQLRSWMGCPIRTSPDHSFLSSSPRLIAAWHVLHRLRTPRHPPHALCNLTKPLKNNGERPHSKLNSNAFTLHDLFSCQRTNPAKSSVELRGFEPLALWLQTRCSPTELQPQVRMWARVDSNYRPHAYQACALTT